MKKLFATAACLGVMFITPALAVDRDFDLINSTGYTIKEIYIDEAFKDNWTDNQLDGTLEEGDKVRMKFGKGDVGCKWDMKVIWTDGVSGVWKNFDLCEINSIRLKYNATTKTTTAVTD